MRQYLRLVRATPFFVTLSSKLTSCHPSWSLYALSLTVKNVKTRCKGLSPALFFFAILGDTTYALSICASKRGMDWDYLVTNASWLAGIPRFSYSNYCVLDV